MCANPRDNCTLGDVNTKSLTNLEHVLACSEKKRSGSCMSLGESVHICREGILDKVL